MFPVYFELGLDHILDLNGYDHILFIIALCATYRITEWRRVLILVTAFTIGHSVTLALSALNLVIFRSDVIEFLIPVTILVTALYNVLRKDHAASNIKFSYLIALVFGWIHGLGFSNYFKALLGGEESVVGPLFAFNIGVEVGQIIIVAITMAVGFVIMSKFKASQREWTLFVSGAAVGIALMLMMDAKFW